MLEVFTRPVSASALCSVVTVTPLTAPASCPLTSHCIRGAGRLARVLHSAVTLSPTSYEGLATKMSGPRGRADTAAVTASTPV